MSLLQNPIKVLDQIEWYLDNQSMEKFPGAFLRSSGNLSRQLLEQILFILAFYCKMPENKYMKTNRQLRTADIIWENLQKQNPITDRTYIEDARFSNPRIRKFARLSRSFNKWRRLFNETSHYQNPITSSHTKENDIRNFVTRLRRIIDTKDFHLILFAANELVSKGDVRVIIGDDAMNTPGLFHDLIVIPEIFSVVNKKITWHSKPYKMQVIPPNGELSQLKWKNNDIFILCETVRLGIRCITEDGELVDMENFSAILKALGKTPEARVKTTRYFKKMGIIVEYREITTSSAIQTS